MSELMCFKNNMKSVDRPRISNSEGVCLKILRETYSQTSAFVVDWLNRPAVIAS